MTGGILAICIIAIIVMAVELNDLVKERNQAQSAISSEKEYHEKTEAYFMPISQDNIKDFLFDGPIEANIIDESTLSFEDGNIFIVDTGRLPMLHIKTGYQLSGGEYDWDMIKTAASYVQDEVIMVETSVAEGHFVEFHISCCEMNMGHLREAWGYYRAVLLHSREQFVKTYNRLHDEASNESYMKKDSPEAQLERMTNQIIASKTEEAERNAVDIGKAANYVS